MIGGEIWWGQIGNSLRFLSNVTNSLQDCHSAVLQIPEVLPWRYAFYEAVDIRRSSFSAERRMVRVTWEPGATPGEFVLDELCSAKLKANYWPGQTYGQYLAAQDDIDLNDYYVWVCGIHSKADLQKWVEFVSQYTHASSDPESRAVFILEYDGPATETAGLPIITYSVELYDCRVFCMETAAALKNTDTQDYQSELALCIGGNDPEFCGALLQAGKDLLENPVETAQQIVAILLNSEGNHFPCKTELQINRAVWNAAVVLLFPILERYRMGYIQKHEQTLSQHLPISNSNGDTVTDPYDLEIGQLFYITSTDSRHFSGTDITALRLYRKVRNLLAHNKAPSYSDVLNVLNLN